jgi:hypothetical protein
MSISYAILKLTWLILNIVGNYTGTFPSMGEFMVPGHGGADWRTGGQTQVP